jgi:hypothetical protein
VILDGQATLYALIQTQIMGDYAAGAYQNLIDEYKKETASLILKAVSGEETNNNS